MEAFWESGPIWKHSQKQKAEVKEPVWCPHGELLHPSRAELEIGRSSTRQPGEMWSFICTAPSSPSAGPLSSGEISSLGATDCKPGLPAGAPYQSWRWFRELMILVAYYLMPPCPWLSLWKRRCYTKELILVSSARLPPEASVERIG